MIRVDMIRKVVIIAVGGKIGKPFLSDYQLLILDRLEDPTHQDFPDRADQLYSEVGPCYLEDRI
ncbi:hypothetical protein BH10PLA2_BH10PLA2_38810 [soil metagenome]